MTEDCPTEVGMTEIGFAQIYRSEVGMTEIGFIEECPA